MAGALHVKSYVFIANFWRELPVVDFGVFAAVAPLLELSQLLAHPGLVLLRAVEGLAFIFCPLLPAIHVEAISEHEHVLHDGAIVCDVGLLTALPQIERE